MKGPLRGSSGFSTAPFGHGSLVFRIPNRFLWSRLVTGAAHCAKIPLADARSSERNGRVVFGFGSLGTRIVGVGDRCVTNTPSF
jgi:hypothetical protein